MNLYSQKTNDLESDSAGATVWSEEKIFTLEQACNRKNNRVLAFWVKIFLYPLPYLSCPQNQETGINYGMRCQFQSMEITIYFYE